MIPQLSPHFMQWNRVINTASLWKTKYLHIKTIATSNLCKKRNYNTRSRPNFQAYQRTGKEFITHEQIRKTTEIKTDWSNLFSKIACMYPATWIKVTLLHRCFFMFFYIVQMAPDLAKRLFVSYKLQWVDDFGNFISLQFHLKRNKRRQVTPGTR